MSTLPFVEPFTGSDGAAPNPAVWTRLFEAPAVADRTVLSGNTCRMALSDGGYTELGLKSDLTVGDFEALLHSTSAVPVADRGTSNGEHYKNVLFRVVAGGWSNSNPQSADGYLVELHPSTTAPASDPWRLLLTRRNGAVSTVLINVAGPAAGVFDHTIRVRVIGQRIRVRVWERYTPEPGTWQIDLTDSGAGSHSTPGLFGLAGITGSAARPDLAVTWDELQVTAAFTTNPVTVTVPERGLWREPVQLLAGSGEPAVFTWAFTSRPTGSTAVLSDPSAANPTFTADQVGTYAGTVQVASSSGSTTQSWTVPVGAAAWKKVNGQRRPVRIRKFVPQATPINVTLALAGGLHQHAAGSPALTQTSAPTVPSETIHRWASPSGSDSNPGTEAQPFRTVQKLAGSLSAGMTGALKPGTYSVASAGQTLLNTGESVHGTSFTNMRRIIGQPGAARPLLIGAVYINSDYTSVEGVDIDIHSMRGSVQNPIGMARGNRSITGGMFKHCLVDGGYSLAQGFLLGGSSLPANNCRIIGCFVRRIVGPSSSGPGHGIYHQNGTGLQAWGNIFYDIQGYDGSRGIQIYPGSSGSYIGFNTIVECGGGVVYGNGNTSGKTSNNHYLEGNIIAFCATRGAVTSDGATSGNRCDKTHLHANPAGITASGTTITASTSGDPQFINPAGSNFKLATSSPAAGRGAYASIDPPWF